MTIFIVGGEEKEVVYTYNGMDVSEYFIRNTHHGMDIDDGRFIASEDDYEWWTGIIATWQAMDAIVQAYRAKFGNRFIDMVVKEESGGEYEEVPAQVINALENYFGKI